MAAFRLFSSSASRTLWIVAAVVAALVLAALGATAFAERGEGDREEVARYIAAVNRVQGGLAGELARVNATYSSFRADPATSSEQTAGLRRSERTLGLLDQQLRALEVPEDAERLHDSLLLLVELQRSFAREVTQLGVYLPRLAAAEQSLAPAGVRVQRELKASEKPADQARAFGRYAAALERVAARLDRLSAPPVLEPARLSEEARLRRLATLGEQLRAAILAGRTKDIERLAARIGRETAAAGATRSERDAIVAYNERLTRIRNQGTAVTREQLVLQRGLD